MQDRPQRAVGRTRQAGVTCDCPQRYRRWVAIAPCCEKQEDRLRPFSKVTPGGKKIEMLYTVAVVLLIAWVLGLLGTYTIGAFVHVLLVVALVLFLVGSLSGRRRLI